MAITFSSVSRNGSRARGAGVTAVLGPTNTGKTHLAIERMLAHSSGMIGLPLRLLAREVYGKVAERVGEASVALITGEEKIKPANPRFWVSTVEAMLSGLVPIRTPSEGARDQIRDGETGYIVPFSPPEVLADRLDQLAADESLRHRLAVAARAHALQYFRADQMVAETLAVYRDAVREGR